MAWDPVWEKIFQENEWGKYPAESLIRFVARNFYKKDRASVRILELGCGPGANIWYLAREGFQAYGIDGSATAIEKGKARLAAEGLKATLCVGDIAQLPYDDGYFDAVIDVECLSCNSMENVRGILKEVTRVLKPKGLFYSRTFSEQFYIGRELNESLEFDSVPDGAMGGKGFLRLITRDRACNLYGDFFDSLSIDENSWTVDNGNITIHEYIVTGERAVN